MEEEEEEPLECRDADERSWVNDRARRGGGDGNNGTVEECMKLELDLE